MATSPGAEDPEDEVEFVSEGPLRPVLEYVDLLSDEDEEAETSAAPDTIEDQVDRKKAQVASTLDRLAQQVAAQKQQRAEKCRAFKERMVSQQAKGHQEVDSSHTNGSDFDAKRCVDMWLKMPGLKPGSLSSGSRWERRPSAGPSRHPSIRTCPVVNCGRLYDSAPLLEGHLKRFDHSPCDPTIMLRGSPSAFYACVTCCRHFDSEDRWRAHLRAKLSSPDPEGHVSGLKYQLIQCFACPSCYLLFNIRDECLQHMAARNHFARSAESGKSAGAKPVPIPRFAKNHLIVLCKEVRFCVRCTACRSMLSSHKEAQAHFNVRCRHASAIAEADQTVADVAKQLRARGRCLQCQEVFCDEDQTEGHGQRTGHEVALLSTEEEAILHYCSYHEALRTCDAPMERQPGLGPRAPSQKRDMVGVGDGLSPAKRQRTRPLPRQSMAWFCECGLRFAEEAAASRHLMAANQVFHKCGVCGKLMSEPSVARLHMSRIHGGAHLSHFLFHCRRCAVDLPREADVMSHVGSTHHGHTHYQEREVTEDDDGGEPSASTPCKPCAVTGPTSSAKSTAKWLCRMCEDLFESREAVEKHCRDVGSHSFQRFQCGLCPQRFVKELTLRRHCDTEHGGRVDMRWCCGLCDSMQYDSEEEFLQHYRSLHGEDYCRVDDPPSQALAPAAPAGRTCPCMGTEKNRAERNTTFTRCMKRLASEGRCHYTCTLCAKQISSYIHMKVHVQEEHGTHRKDKAFEVVCGLCSERHTDVPGFHTHYHAQHCPRCPRQGHGDTESDTKVAVPIVLKAEEISPTENNKFDNDLKCALALSAEEARKQTEFEREIEEAIKRSMLDF